MYNWGRIIPLTLEGSLPWDSVCKSSHVLILLSAYLIRYVIFVMCNCKGQNNP